MNSPSKGDKQFNENLFMTECTSSPTGKHQYDPYKYERDDQMFYCKCVHCKQTHDFECDTYADWERMWDIDDED